MYVDRKGGSLWYGVVGWRYYAERSHHVVQRGQCLVIHVMHFRTKWSPTLSSKRLSLSSLWHSEHRGEFGIYPPSSWGSSFIFLFHSEWPRANKAKHHLRWLLRYYNAHSNHSQLVHGWNFLQISTAVVAWPQRQIVLHSNFLSFALYCLIDR